MRETFVTKRNQVRFRAFLLGGGGPQIGEITCGGSPHRSCKRDQIILVRDYMDRRVTSPTWDPPPPFFKTPLVALRKRYTYIGMSSECQVRKVCTLFQGAHGTDNVYCVVHVIYSLTLKAFYKRNKMHLQQLFLLLSIIGHSRVPKSVTFKMRPTAILSFENKSYLRENEKSSPYQRLST